MERILEITNLKKQYKNGRGVENVSLTVHKGEVVGLLGPNGSGKTTTMRVVTGLSTPNSGSVKIFGEDILENYEKAAEKMGALIEMPAIYLNMTAWQNLKIAAAYYDGVDDDRIRHILSLVHLDSYRNVKTGALLSNPEFVVLDEPANGLDIEGIIQIREMITALCEKHGVAFLLASHIASELEKTCHKIAVLHEGKMLAFESMEQALQFHPSLEDYFLSVVRGERGEVAL